MSIAETIAALFVLAGASGQRAAIRDVNHDPKQPKPGVAVLVSAKMPSGTAKTILKLQVVAPGKYVRKSDPDYEKDWIDLMMHDDGQEGDAKGGDGVFSVRPRDVAAASVARSLPSRRDRDGREVNAIAVREGAEPQLRLVV